MEFILLIFLGPAGLFAKGIGFAEIIEEVIFRRKAIKTNGSIVGKVAARYKPKIQFTGYGSYSGVTETSDVRKLSGYIGIIEYHSEDR